MWAAAGWLGPTGTVRYEQSNNFSTAIPGIDLEPAASFSREANLIPAPASFNFVRERQSCDEHVGEIRQSESGRLHQRYVNFRFLRCESHSRRPRRLARASALPAANTPDSKHEFILMYKSLHDSGGRGIARDFGD